METGLLHTHSLVASLYTLLIIVLTFFIITRNKNAFTTLRLKLRWPRVVLEVLLLATGGILLNRAPDGLSPDYLIKYGVTVGAVVLAVVGFRRYQPLPATLSIVLLVYLFYAARQHDWRLQSVESRSEGIGVLTATSPETQLADGQRLYAVNCVRCHGENGRAQYRKAPDLARFAKGDAYADHLLVNGLNTMPAFAHLNENQRLAVIAYLNSLRGEVQAQR